ncbi:hypothetical protein HID58_011613, partial [Brassica napus]
TLNVFTSSYLFSAANHRVYHESPDHLRRVYLLRSSCSDSSVAVMLILAVSVLPFYSIQSSRPKPHLVCPRSNDGDVTAARRKNVDTVPLWCGGDVVTAVRRKHAKR